MSPGNPGDWTDLDAGGSVLYLRMAARSHIAGSMGTMPPMGTKLQDDIGLSLVSDWITQLECP